MAKKKPAAGKKQSPSGAKPIRIAKPADDLTKIEGIGPKIEKLLKEDGIDSFSKLARASTKRLQGILDNAGPRYRSHDPGTWKQQSALTAKGNWDELKALQKKLIGGRDYSPKKPEQSTIVAFSSTVGGDYEPGKPFVIERILSDQEADQEYLARKDELDTEIAKAQWVIRRMMETTKSNTKDSKNKTDTSAKIHTMIRDGEVTGISTKFRTKFGHAVSPLSVVIAVNVKRKLPKDQLDEQNILPREIDGVPVKVLEGSFHLLTAQNGYFLRGAKIPERPLPFDVAVLGGVPIAPLNSPTDFGTLGVLSKNANNTVGLTCQHVVNGDTGDVLLQLGPNIGVRDAFVVETVVKSSDRNINFGGVVESVDCAYVKVKPDGTAIVLPRDGVWIQEICAPDTTVVPIVFGNRDLFSTDASLPLWKFGNGSGEKIKGKIGWPRIDRIFISSREYQNNFAVSRYDDSGRPFAFPGDSGSVLVVEAKAEIDGGPEKDCFVAIGILFAALSDSTKGVACTMVRVLKGLGLAGKVPTVDHWRPRLTNEN